MAQFSIKALEWAADTDIGRPESAVSGQVRQKQMVSDIKGLNSRQAAGPGQSRSTEVTNASRAGDPAREARDGSDDTVELSGLSEVIRATARSLAGQPAVNQARVSELKSAIANGEYQIDPQRIAQKLIDTDSL